MTTERGHLAFVAFELKTHCPMLDSDGDGVIGVTMRFDASAVEILMLLASLLAWLNVTFGSAKVTFFHREADEDQECNEIT